MRLPGFTAAFSIPGSQLYGPEARLARISASTDQVCLQALLKPYPVIPPEGLGGGGWGDDGDGDNDYDGGNDDGSADDDGFDDGDNSDDQDATASNDDTISNCTANCSATAAAGKIGCAAFGATCASVVNQLPWTPWPVGLGKLGALGLCALGTAICVHMVWITQASNVHLSAANRRFHRM